MPPRRPGSSPELPRYAPKISDAKFAAVLPPPELAPVIFWPEDFDHPAAKIQIKAMQSLLVDHENRLRAKEGEHFAAVISLAIDESLEERDTASTLTWARALKAALKWLLVALVGAGISHGAKWWLEPKSAPAIQYDRDGNPRP